MTLRILLADDHKIVLDGLTSMLEKSSSVSTVKQALDGLAAVKMAEEFSPDIAIIDISMPGMNGIEVTRRILAIHPETKIIILSMHADGRYISAALKEGAMGYLLKESAFDELTEAIRSVVRGQVFLSTAITDTVVKDYLRYLVQEKASVFSVLSAREREILQMISEGISTKQIAKELDVSVKTVETHRKNIMDKLDIHSIAELTKYAIREGITSL
ncbi:MAG TPA: response regulator transcription factor [Thermoanaerobaculia bacterium]|nr:response regulator transcription factor [Thermoanaerobaculia bacterium]HUM30699.1 response regulator transcription factor [Thermoanaerobaculia bacterium]HXK68893.1 response regulator transcription factor [Thermoanaerobaculia bacterium]